MPLRMPSYLDGREGPQVPDLVDEGDREPGGKPPGRICAEKGHRGAHDHIGLPVPSGHHFLICAPPEGEHVVNAADGPVVPIGGCGDSQKINPIELRHYSLFFRGNMVGPVAVFEVEVEAAVDYQGFYAPDGQPPGQFIVPGEPRHVRF